MTDKSKTILNKDEKNMLLRISQKFDAAHQLNGYEGKCAQLHGHTWRLELCIQVGALAENGISIDFQEVKDYLKRFLPDHQNINEYLSMRYPTAENLAMYFYRNLKKRFPGLKKIVLWETENNGVEYAEGI